MLTLGLSGGFGHDAAACLVRDGEVLVVVEEERVSRFKGAFGQAPVRAIQQAVDYLGLDLRAIDQVALGWDPSLDADLGQMEICRDAVLAAPGLRAMRADVTYLDHHLCHATTALAAANWTDMAILVIDGRGERSSSSVYRARNGHLELRAQFDVVDSLGSFFSAATRFAGFDRGAEGKLMGLASYGSPRELPAFELTDDGYRAAIRLDRSGSPTARHRKVRSQWFALFERYFGPPRLLSHRQSPDQEDFAHWAEFAATVQSVLTEATAHLCKFALAETRCDSLALAGGVALNCTTNGALRKRYGSRLSLYGCMGDAGTAIGAALETDARESARRKPLSTAYLGLGYEDDEVRRDLHRLHLEWEEPDDVGASAASLVAEGAIIGWFQGRSEIGPRALGHRSILASPTTTAARDAVNVLKQREPWRPLAPSLFDSAAKRLYGVESSPYMIEAVAASSEAVRRIPACVHADGTSRLHTVQEEGCGRLQTLLKGIQSHTGTAACLNTSFNVGPEPIVNSVTDAVRTFYGSGLDALVIGPAILRKRA